MKFPERLSLKTSVNSLEDSIITLSGPALAVSGIIAGVDLLTGGHVFSIAWLTLAWAICLLISLDFQVLALGARSHQTYLSNKSGWRKVGEIAICFLIAAAISSVSIQMQSVIARANSQSGITIDQAALQMGVNMVALTWERSILVLVLIFMSGWLREEQPQEQERQPAAGGTNGTLTDEALQLILSKLAKLDELEQRLAAQPVIVSEQEAPTLQLQAPASDAQEALASEKTRVDKEAEQPLLLERFQSKEQQIADVLQRLPGATPEQIAQEAGCSVRTATKWLTRLQQESGA